MCIFRNNGHIIQLHYLRKKKGMPPFEKILPLQKIKKPLRLRRNGLLKITKVQQKR